MAVVNAKNKYFKDLNDEIRGITDTSIQIYNALGQRFIAAGSSGKTFTINGVPGNALGAYLNGSLIDVLDNAQDAVGDTMNDGTIIVHGSVGDACGYAMRGGKIYIRDKAGYRAGIHMKAYKEKQPLIIIGEQAGSFLGEYLAGGTIIVLGIGMEGRPPVGYFCGTGMHGGKMFLRTDYLPADLPPQVAYRTATEDDKKEISDKITEYCQIFGFDRQEIMRHNFFVLTPNSANPYRQMYANV